MCICSTDDEVTRRWGDGYIEMTYGKRGVKSIWDWGEDSGILPCPIYLRHCVLAASKQVGGGGGGEEEEEEEEEEGRTPPIPLLW